MPFLKRLRLLPNVVRRPLSSLGGQLFFTLAGVTCISLIMVIGVVIWETRMLLTQHKGESFQALALSSSQRLVAELAREIELLDNLAQENSFFYQAFGSTENDLSALSPSERETLLREQDQMWQRADETLHVRVREHPASSDLDWFARKFPTHVQLIYVDRWGTLVASGGRPAERYYYGRESWWRKAWNDGKGNTYVRQLARESDRQETLIEIAIPVRLLGTHSAHGVLRSRFSISDLSVFTDFLNLNNLGFLTVVDFDGTVVYSSQPNRLGKTMKTAIQPQYSATSLGWDLSQDDDSNENVIRGYATLNPSLKHAYLRPLGWTLLVQQPTAAAMATANRLSLFAILGGIGVLGLAMLVSQWVAKRVVHPIQELTQTAVSMANGNLECQAKILGTTEFRTLARSFNTMTAQLRHAITTLEQRVRERTLELKKAKEASDLANKAKSEFLANMSHELRTPLNGILGYAQILEQTKTISEQERHGINIIHQCGTHLLMLINDVLDLAKIEARKLELVSTALHLPSLLQSVVEMCKIKAEQKGIQFIYQPSSRLPAGVKTDEKRLRQVLINLLGNAIKFTDSGSVTLRVDVLAQSEAQVSLLFQAIDTGIGIATEDISQLFEAFEQIGDRQKQAEGTGLGLAISQRIVQLMESTIEVKSQLGQGSEFFFTVELPLVENWIQQRGSDERRIIGYEGSRRTILTIDDRWENRIVLRHLLESLDFKTVEAENGQEGLEKLRSSQPNLTILDLAMPMMDGFEFLRQIRNSEDLKQTKVVVSSASVSQADRQAAIASGGDEFLAKPIDAKLLLQVLSEQLNLVWIYEEQAVSPSKPDPSKIKRLPPTAELEQLLDWVKSGMIMEIQAWAEQSRSGDYPEAATHLYQLAKEFQLKAIRSCLEQWLIAPEDTVS